VATKNPFVYTKWDCIGGWSACSIAIPCAGIQMPCTESSSVPSSCSVCFFVLLGPLAPFTSCLGALQG